jgi:hypothetical protein
VTESGAQLPVMPFVLWAQLTTGQPPAGGVPGGTITKPLTLAGLFAGNEVDQYWMR